MHKLCCPIKQEGSFSNIYSEYTDSENIETLQWKCIAEPCSIIAAKAQLPRI